MAKLNFKSMSSISRSSKTPSKSDLSQGNSKKENEPVDENLDQNSESSASFYPKVEPESGEEVASQLFIQEEPSPQPTTNEQKFTFRTNDDYSYTSNGSGKKYFIILSLIVILISAGIFAYFKNFHKTVAAFFEKKQPTEKITKIPTTTETSTEEQQLLPPIFSKNYSHNQFISTQLQNIFNKKPSVGEYSLIILDRSEIKFTILVNSRNDITQLSTDLKKNFPDLNYKATGIQSKFTNGSEAVYANYRTTYTPSTQSPDQKVQSGNLEVQNFTTEIQNLSKKNNINIFYLKEGKKTVVDSYTQNLYYMNISGKKENILNFISGLAQTYPMLLINKVSIGPYNLETISDNNVSSRLNLTWFSSKQN
jgi:hypothetical protein